jgi:predicted transcriptional regulator
MSTTTIRIPDELKTRIAAAAERAGSTAHSFILEAIMEKADQEERRNAFHDLAEQRYQDILATGKTIAWNDMRAYLLDRATNKNTPRPVAKPLSQD